NSHVQIIRNVVHPDRNYLSIILNRRIGFLQQHIFINIGYNHHSSRFIISIRPHTKHIQNFPDFLFLCQRNRTFAAPKYARSKGLKVLANWHSHPASPSRRSQEDLRLANDPTIRYAILSLLNGEPRLNSFKILNGEVVEKESHL
ncbi:MAG: Mov34/MPN/PAD-1 family protein, partial [Prevotella sp.]|nr:Mov34/MPN/PAD-1 family protein [Prevotella sp.]